MSDLMNMEEMLEQSELAEQSEQTELTEQTLGNAELTAQMEQYEANYKEAMEAGSNDMAEYYKEKIEALKGKTEDKEMSLGYGNSPKYYYDLAAKEYAKNGESYYYKSLMEKAAKEEIKDKLKK